MTKTIHYLVSALAVLALASCSTSATRKNGTPVQRGALTHKRGVVVVQRGDSLYAIASRAGIAVRELADWNNIGTPYTIYPGQHLRLPPTDARLRSSGPIDSGIRWHWPAEGVLIGRYVAGEPTQPGIDIAGSSGTPIRAAADGVVLYSGAGLTSQGELIVVQHNEQWLSVYAHNRKRMVSEGQHVKAGAQIAQMGRTGAARDMLHFEIRYDTTTVDPLLYLPKR